MYKGHLINPLIQFGRMEFDLLFEDEDGILPAQRTVISFPDTATENEINTKVNERAEKYTNEPLEGVPEIDLPEAFELTEQSQ